MCGSGSGEQTGRQIHVFTEDCLVCFFFKLVSHISSMLHLNIGHAFCEIF